MIYLDSAATTKPKQEVIDAMMPYFTEKWHNPSSLYSDINSEIEKARQTIANFINAQKDEIYFTSGGSESNCWAIQGFVNWCHKNGKSPAVITTRIEHKSIIECVDNIDANCFYLNVNKYGLVDEDNLSEYLMYCDEAGYTTLVSIQIANNEIGTIQYIRRLSNIVHLYNAVLHTDAVQAFGKIRIDVEDRKIDLMSVSGHKFGCPKGIGFLYIRNGIQIEPLIYGAQERGMRGGTENVPYIIGMKKAIEILYREKTFAFNQYIHLEVRGMKAYEKLNNHLESKYGCTKNGVTSLVNRLFGIVSYRFPDNINIDIESLMLLLTTENICVSAGSACNSHSQKPSHVLKAIGLSDDECRRTMRISFECTDLTEEMVDEFIDALDKSINIIQADCEL